ncbi:MAG TPA: DUF2844 domain-containing protein [Geobacteraceae bacterium]|nr:DUF2844 domain-containing protein [Geobacteraceae bacterium]
MKIRYHALALCFCILASIPAAVHLCRATLGESADSVPADRKALAAVRHSTTNHENYSVQEIQSDVNVVREYISPSGIVFAIAWNGLTRPDLSTLLGSYAPEYLQALQKSPRKPGRRYSKVRSDRVVVEQWGHMRNLQGRAYVPDLIPPGVSIDDIK